MNADTLCAVIATVISVFGLFGIKGENLKEGGTAISKGVKRDYAHQRLGIVIALAILLIIVGVVVQCLAMLFVSLQEPAKLIAQFLNSNGANIPLEVSDFSSTTIAFAILIMLAAASFFSVDAFLHGFGITMFGSVVKAARFKRRFGGVWNWIAIVCLVSIMLLGYYRVHVSSVLLIVLLAAVPIAPIIGYIITFHQIKDREKTKAESAQPTEQSDSQGGNN
jgi:hypothetical protein